MRYEDLLAWANGQTTMYLVSEGEMRPIDFYSYSLMPLADMPSDARLTTNPRLAYIISAAQKRKQ